MNKKVNFESIQETQEKLNKVGEALGIIEKIELDKPEDIYAKDIVAKNINNDISSKLNENLELTTMIDDFNFMRDNLKYNIEKSKIMMSSISEGFNAYNENSAILVTGYANLVKAVNDSINLFSNLHKILNQIIDKKSKIENNSEKNANSAGFSIAELTKILTKNDNMVEGEIIDCN